ncbi:Immunity protein 21 [Actinacidiphila yanglinensis]|uniref:Immunity protein 21 n=1 Tax=Actinacidiphila yanglinensis TaxID=310779 RepID=A0A1H6DZM6_9ACTN|nr:Imm21 family immunity protein [Actinacidiphila yanglinensis]SEG90569.1 Immunity protein 21 [Actinacidiphila yanglinensis]
MMTSSFASSCSAKAPTWVQSMGGPLIAIPLSALDGWGGSTELGMVISDGDIKDDYDRACEVDGLAGVVGVGSKGAQGLVLADEPATTCYLPELRVFVRWLGADSDADLIAAAKTVLADSAVEWEECGLWETDGAAVLMDSADDGAELNVEYPNGGGMPDQAPIPIPPGRWAVRAVHTSVDEETSVGLVQLFPAPRLRAVPQLLVAVSP